MGPQQTTTQGYVLWWTVGWLERRIIRKDAMVGGLVSDRVSEWVILWGIVCVDGWLKPNIHRTITPRHTTRLHFKPLLLPYISIFYGQLIIGNPIIIITRLTVGWSPCFLNTIKILLLRFYSYLSISFDQLGGHEDMTLQKYNFLSPLTVLTFNFS